jgi:hypothetical protein
VWTIETFVSSNKYGYEIVDIHAYGSVIGR